jgi:ubiquitin conjugation factor E4 B
VLDTRSFKVEIFDKAVKILNNPKKGVQIEYEAKEKFEKMTD